MSHGGRQHPVTGAWLVRVQNLRPGDRIQCTNWNGSYWFAGYVMVVGAESVATGLRDGFHLLWTYDENCPSETRELCLRPTDEVTIASRPVEKPASPRKKSKKGQMSLF